MSTQSENAPQLLLTANKSFNLCKGHAVFTFTLLNLVCSHIDPGWATTHLLSFSEDKETGLRSKYRQVDKLIKYYGEYYENDAYWEFGLITIDTRKISWTPLSRIVYSGIYERQLLKFKSFAVPTKCF